MFCHSHGFPVILKWLLTSVFQREEEKRKCKERVVPISEVIPTSLVELLSCVRLLATAWTAARQVSLSITNSQSLLTQRHVHWVGDAIQPPHLLSSPSPPTFNLSQHQGLFKRVSSSHQVAKVLKFSFSISPSNEYSGLISFRIDWLNILAVQGCSRVFSNTTVQNHQFFGAQLCF